MKEDEFYKQDEFESPHIDIRNTILGALVCTSFLAAFWGLTAIAMAGK